MNQTYRTNYCVFLLSFFLLFVPAGCSVTKHDTELTNKYRFNFVFINYEDSMSDPDLSQNPIRIYCYNNDYNLIDWFDVQLSSGTENNFSLSNPRLAHSDELIIYAITLDNQHDLVYPEKLHSIADFSVCYPPTQEFKPIDPIFSGLRIVKNSQTQPAERIQIPISRKVGNIRFHLSHKGLNPDHLYDVEIRNINARLNIHDVGSDGRLHTIIPFSVSSKNQLSTDKLTMFPSGPEDGLHISLRKNGQTIWSADKDKDGKPFQCLANELVEFYLSVDSLSTSVEVKPWEDIETDIEI